MTKQYGTPGPRALHPELCDSPSLGRCGILANALFPRLIAQADDQGRLPGRAREVQVQCIPHLAYVGADEVEAALAELEAEGHLRRYDAGGRSLLQLATWWRWQASMRRAYPSRWEPPKGWHDLVYGIGGEGPQRFDEAVAASPRSNAAIRGIVPRIAAIRSPRDGRARGRLRAAARAGQTRPDPTINVAGAGAPGGARAPEPVGETLAEMFARTGIPLPAAATKGKS